MRIPRALRSLAAVVLLANCYTLLPGADRVEKCSTVGQTFCAGVGCRNLSGDHEHCGRCGRACSEGERCVAGECVCTLRGQAFCPGFGCRNLLGDPAHCGNCGVRCPAGAFCDQGLCRCPPPQIECAERCVDPSMTRDHCGACGESCARMFTNAATACDGARCIGPAQCAVGFGDCDGVIFNGCEVDLRVSAENCGVCGRVCRAGQVCEEGACGAPCPAGHARCGGGCRDLRTDRAHCGRCGAACVEGQECALGACVCRAGTLRCGGSCVDVSSAVSHCGACGRACALGQICSGGTCQGSQCAGGQMICGGVCSDLRTDPANCGLCGRICLGGEYCRAGACASIVPIDGGVDANSSDREPVDVCVSDTSSDPRNCGACGVVCPTDATCVAGRCVVSACPAGLTLCNGSCVDLAADPAHCGACGRACAVPGAASACVAGVCRGGACSAGFADCDRSAANGCEVYLATPQNCGLCGRACTGGQVCADGACVCPADCVRCGATCVDPRTDAAHCGACGRACAAPLRCAGGGCLPG